jgi:hypothetical protein
VILVWFLAIYYVLYLILNLTQSASILSMNQFFDMIVFGIVILYAGITYLFLRENIVTSIGISYLNYLNDPYSIFSLSLFLVVFYLVLFLLGIVRSPPLVVSIVESLAWITLALLFIIDTFKFILGVPLLNIVSEYIAYIWNDLPQNLNPDPTATTDGATKEGKEEVFHVADNMYTYDDAQAVCSSYGATLANYNQINDYYNNGGEFCGYGWSTDQMALFPTQESTWKKLQHGTKEKNKCGRPGINGGVFDASYKFGVNCYGVKPTKGPNDITCMGNIPKTPEEVALDEKIQFYKENAKSMHLDSFNHSQWSEWEKNSGNPT